MSIYEERLEHDLEQIRDQTGQLGRFVVQAVQDSTEALRSNDKQLAYQTILRDQIANRLAQSIDQLCHAFVVRHSPSAGHLRFVSSVLRISIALERIGDYSVTIAREMVRLSQKLSERVIRDLDVSVGLTIQSLRQALKAFHESNPELARGTKKMASEQGCTFDIAFADLVDQGEEGLVPVRDLFAQIIVFNRLSRVCDQAKNICEETVFVALGEPKPPKEFRILFTDEGKDQVCRMAMAIAQGNYQGKAEFFAASLEPTGESPIGLNDFMAKRGHDLTQIEVGLLKKGDRTLSRFHVIIALEKGVAEALGKPPYNTVFLDWSSEISRPEDEEYDRAQLTYETLFSKIADLMEILSGLASD